MFKILFLAILSLVAVAHSGKEGTGTDAAPPQEQEVQDLSRTFSDLSTQEKQDPSTSSPVSNDPLFLVSTDDMDLVNQSALHKKQPVICNKTPFYVTPDDKDYFCAVTALYDVMHCSNNLIPTVKKLTEQDLNSDEMNDVSCGPKNREGSLFSFGYQACNVRTQFNGTPLQQQLQVQENSDFFEVYKFCHSKKDNGIIYTKHTIRNPDFLTGYPQKLQREKDVHYNMITNGFEYFGSYYLRVEMAYKILRAINEMQMTRVGFSANLHPSDSAMQAFMSSLKAQQLVPVDDMAFRLARRTTFHFLNLAAMPTGHLVLWNFMNYLIREDARKNSRIYSINTIAYHKNSTTENESAEVDSKGVDREKENNEEGHTERVDFREFEFGGNDNMVTVGIQVADVWIKMIKYEEPASESGQKGEVKSLAIVMNISLNATELKILHNKLSCEKNLCEDALAAYQTFSSVRKSVRCCSAKKVAERFFDEELDTESSFQIKAFTEPHSMSSIEEMAFVIENATVSPVLP